MESFKDYDVFDIAESLYFWLQHNWSGQSDQLYLSFCQLTAPGMYRQGGSQLFQDIHKDALEIYKQLNESNYQFALDIVLNYKSVC